jgi:ubiquinone/menaquinone biosynthesis C-methylase UbiE
MGLAVSQQELPCPTPELTPKVYSQWRQSKLGNLTETIERGLLLELLGQELKEKNILEIGCGDGNLAVELYRVSNGSAQITAVDASSQMIESARQKAYSQNANVSFGVAMADKLPFENETFHVVVAQTILCFVEDPLPVFREIARVLKPGGHLVIGELGKWSTWALERRIRAMRGSTLWKKGFFRTSNELRDLAARSGLVPDCVRGAVFYPRWFPMARLVAPYDAWLGQQTCSGAAFIAMKATKLVQYDIYTS